MKQQYLVMGVLAPALLFQVACHRKPSLTSDKAKVSYAIGENIARNVKAQHIELDADVVGYAVTQGLKGEKPDISIDDQKKALQKLQEQVQGQMMAEAQKNEQASEQFLNKNKLKDGVKETADGLQYEVIKKGTGPKPTLKDSVQVQYTGTLINGQKFDSSVDRGKPAEFPVNGIIKGWQEALQMMPEGSVWRLYIPPKLGYGTRAQPGIPANSVLVFDVQLLKVEKPGKSGKHKSK